MFVFWSVRFEILFRYHLLFDELYIFIANRRSRAVARTLPWGGGGGGCEVNRQDKYYYLQFNVTTKIEKMLEIWSLQIVRKGIWPCPSATTPLKVFSMVDCYSNSDPIDNSHYRLILKTRQGDANKLSQLESAY